MAGHASMTTTKRYLAGTVFRDEAEALERRFFGAAEFLRESALGRPSPARAATQSNARGLNVQS
jgi:hypothetical protein